MNKKRMLIAGVAVIVVALLAVQVAGLIRREWHNAVRSHVYTQMQAISGAMQKYHAEHGAYPAALSELCPTCLPSDTLRDRHFRAWCSRKTMVPEYPYAFRLNGSNLFITCQFSGPMYTQVVFECASGEVTPK